MIEAFIWFCRYCWWLPILGLIGIAVAHHWYPISWWWMAIPGTVGVVVGATYLFALLMENVM